MKHRFLSLLLALCGMCILAACSKEPPKNEASSSSISGYNYTSEGIQEFFVNGAWGSGISIGGGGATVCCVNLPEKWTSDLKVTIEWRRSDCGERGPGGSDRCPSFSHLQAGDKIPEWQMKTFKKEVPIEPYEKSDTVQVFFLPNDEVKVYVYPDDPHAVGHPAKLGPPHPLDNPNWKDPQ